VFDVYGFRAHCTREQTVVINFALNFLPSGGPESWINIAYRCRHTTYAFGIATRRAPQTRSRTAGATAWTVLRTIRKKNTPDITRTRFSVRISDDRTNRIRVYNIDYKKQPTLGLRTHYNTVYVRFIPRTKSRNAKQYY